MTTFNNLKTCWDRLSQEDPLWAILSQEDKKGGKWNLDDFLLTGQETVASYHSLLASLVGIPSHFDHILDFGCGIGRLTLSWKQYARLVTGTDISETMINQARQLSANIPGLDYTWNPNPNLSIFPSSSFDLVFSHICLQHIPWPMTYVYLREFSRICRPEGYVVFQLPSKSIIDQSASRTRRWLIDHLPFGLDRAYRSWRRGTSTVFDMHFTPVKEVITACRSFELQDRLLKYDESAGSQTEGYIYVFQKTKRTRFDAA